MATTHTFQAVWPILDETVPYAELIQQATEDLPELALRCRATLVGPGRFSRRKAGTVPGGGQPCSERVLVYVSPANRRPPIAATDRLLKGVHL